MNESEFYAHCILHLARIKKSLEYLKHNPYHDERGRFTTSGNAGFVSLFGKPKEQGKVVGRGSDLPEPKSFSYDGSPQAKQALAAVLDIVAKNEKRVATLEAKSNQLTTEVNTQFEHMMTNIEFGTPEYTAQSEKVDKLFKDLDTVNKQIGQLRTDDVAAKSRKHLYQDSYNEGRIDIEISKDFTPEERKIIQAGVKEAQKLSSHILFYPVKFEKLPAGQGDKKRSHADIWSNTVRLRPQETSKEVVVHELGHIIEEQRGDVHDMAVAFLNHRTRGGNVQKMNEIFGHSGYADHEQTIRDKFVEPYMGKQYLMGNRHYATEIVSMGMQLYQSNPAMLAKHDPEYFTFIHDVLSNRIDPRQLQPYMDSSKAATLERMALLVEYLKHNPYHDERGRFTGAGQAGYVSLWGKPKEAGKVVGLGRDIDNPSQGIYQGSPEAHKARAAVLAVADKYEKDARDLEAKHKQGIAQVDAINEQMKLVPKDSPEWKELSEQRRKAWREVQSHSDNLQFMIENEMMPEAREHLYSGHEGKVDVIASDKFSNMEKELIQMGVDEVRKLSAWGTKRAVAVERLPDGGSERSHYSGGLDNAIRLRGSEIHPAVVAHELGHALEEHNPILHDKAVAFLNARTHGQAPEKLGGGYEAHEVAIPDKFIDPYMGKQYIYGGKHTATEITSMGVQLMYQNPIRLARKDPEMFVFIHDALNGRMSFDTLSQYEDK